MVETKSDRVQPKTTCDCYVTVTNASQMSQFVSASFSNLNRDDQNAKQRTCQVMMIGTRSKTKTTMNFKTPPYVAHIEPGCLILAQIYESKRDVILFCIDCSESMLALYEDPKYENSQTCHLLTALEVAVEIEKRKITVGPNDSVGIILFNAVRISLRSTSLG